MTRGFFRRRSTKIVLAVFVVAVLVGGLFLFEDRSRRFSGEWSVQTARESPAGELREFQLRPTTRSFRIEISTEGCYLDEGDVAAGGVDVEEDEESVIVTAYVQRDWFASSGEADCLTIVSARVELDEPLGQRQLLSGHTDPPSPPPGLKRVLAVEGAELSGQVDVWWRADPLTEQVAERFHTANPKVSVAAIGVGERFAKLCSGEVDLLERSPAISPQNAAACEANGVEYEEVPIGRRYLYVSTASLVEPHVRAFVDYFRETGPPLLHHAASAHG